VTNIIFCLLTSTFLLFTSQGSSFGLNEVVWGRNPFLTREEIRSLQKKETTPMPSTSPVFPQWEVKSILISGSSKVATVNDHIVTVGDFLGEEKVLEINEDSVVLSRDGKRRVIKQKQPSIHIGVKEIK
jgi:hypothetical protein